MNKFDPGQIVLVRFPLFDNSTTKIRPALILKDTYDKDMIICRITGQLYNTKFDYIIPDWKAAGLLLPSVIRIHKIATIDKNLVYKTIGNLESRDTIKIFKLLNDLFDSTT